MSRRVSLTFSMFHPLRLGLLAILRGLRSAGDILKSFVLRCLLFWPRVLRSLRRIWPSCSRIRPKDIPKKKGLGGQARPSFPEAPGCEGYSIIYASRDPNRSSAPHLPFGFSSTEVLQLDPILGQSQSPPHSPESSTGPPSPGSTHLTDRDLPGGSTPSLANPYDIQLPHIPRLSGPLTLTHSRITSAQFAGAPRRSRYRSSSWSPSPLPHSYSFPRSTALESATASPAHSRPPSPFRPSSPLLFPQPHRSPESPVLDSSGGIQIPDVVISPPARSQRTRADSEQLPSSPVSFQEGNLSQFPTGTEHLTLDLSEPGGLGLIQGNGRHSSESLRDNGPAPSSNQARLVYPSQVTLKLEDIPIINDSGNWTDGKRRRIGQMHSEQVSRYVNKGDV
jgi:hypothetical protein